MKYLKLFVTALTLVLVFTVLALAGRAVATSKAPSFVKPEFQTTQYTKSNLKHPLQTRAPGRMEITDPDLGSVGRSFESSIKYDQKYFSPVGKKDSKSTFSVSGLKGTYSIPGDFPSIDAAVAVLNYLGVDSNVVFVLTNTSYTEPAITFMPFNNADVYPVTIEPAAGTAVTVNFTSSLTSGKGFAFNGASGITIDGLNTGGSSLTLGFAAGNTFPSSDAFGATVYITGGAVDIAVNNTTIKGESNNATWSAQTDGRPCAFVYTADEDPHEAFGITFDHDTFVNGTYGLKVLTPGNINVACGALTFTNNHVGGAFGNPVVVGALVELAYMVDWSNNTFDGVDYLYTYYLPAGATATLSYTEFDLDAVFAPGARGASFLHGFGQATNFHMIYVDDVVEHDNLIQNISTDAGAGAANLVGYGHRTYYVGSLGLASKPVIYNELINLNTTNFPVSSLTGIRGDNNYIYQNSIRLQGPYNSGSSTTINSAGGSIENNALSNEITLGTASNIRGISAGGPTDYNAIYSNGVLVAGLNEESAVAAGYNPHGIFGPISFNANLTITTGPSAAENMGASRLPVLLDYAGNPVDTTAAGTRDAGAYQFGSLGAPLGPDVDVCKITNPPGSIVSGVAQIPTVLVKNNNNTATGSFNLELTFPNESYDHIVSVSLAGQATQTVTFPSYLPVPGTETATATSSLAGDIDAPDNVVTLSVTAVAPTAISTSQTYDWESGLQGWSTTHDWTRSHTFTKLGGPFSGYSMVTNCPTDSTVYSQGAYMANTGGPSDGYATQYDGTNLLTSPWVDLSGMAGTDLYISFQQSIACEPGWDGSWVEYTTDGINWHHLGSANDPNGINWQNSSVYANSPSFTGDPPDTVTMAKPTYALWGPAGSEHVFPMGWWSSNGPPGLPSQPAEGDGHPQGPFGYIFTQLHITPATYPDIVHSANVRFRIVAFSDAVNPPNSGAAASNVHDPAFQGWAVDNFRIGTSGSTFTGGMITGTIYHDLDGDGAMDGADTVFTNLPVQISYYGVPVETVMTNGSGMYTFNLSANNSLPGTYNITPLLAGYASSAPASPYRHADVNQPSAGGTATQDIGLYKGQINGIVYNDVNNNSSDNSEPGLKNWTVEVHADSAAGKLINSTTTDVNGVYQLTVPPYSTYVVKEIAQPAIARQTEGASNYSVGVSGASGGGSAVYNAKNFGNWLYASLSFYAILDADGSGDATNSSGGVDHLALPNGAFVPFKFFKNGVQVDSATIGSSILSKSYGTLDLGTYVFQQLSVPTGWIRTDAGGLSDTLVVNASGMTLSDTSLEFKLVTANGYKFNDLNGNGTWDQPAEKGLAGWTINCSGKNGGSTVTDSNGFYQFKVGGGAHTVSEVAQAGWVRTTPSGAGTFVFTPFSASLPGQDQIGDNFGNFQSYNVSGRVYRDYNDDGSLDGPDAGVSGVGLTYKGATAGSTNSGAGGWFSFTVTAPGPETLKVTIPAGFVVSTAGGAQYSWTGTSGDSVSGKNFGLFQSTDASLKYRSFTLDSLQVASATKSIKRDPKKPHAPNLINVLEELFAQAKDSSQATGIMVGEAGQKLNVSDPKSVDKGYIMPSKSTDVQGTLYKKGKTGPLYQSGTPRGLDFFTGGKTRILKLNKSIAPDKHSNMLVGDLMTLGVNIAFSDFGKTAAGFGDLVYIGGGTWNNMSISDIYSAGNNLATNWEFVPTSTFASLDSLVRKINAEFSGPFDTTSFFHNSKTVVSGVKAVSASSIFKPATDPTPRVKAYEHYDAIPTTFSLSQNYPNPFNPTTTINFALPLNGTVTIKVYNILGQEITTLLDNESFYAGNQQVTFDATSYTSGVYFYRITTTMTNNEGVSNTLTQTKKMMLMK